VGGKNRRIMVWDNLGINARPYGKIAEAKRSKPGLSGGVPAYKYKALSTHPSTTVNQSITKSQRPLLIKLTMSK
jgi:hypothetical protein